MKKNQNNDCIREWYWTHWKFFSSGSFGNRSRCLLYCVLSLKEKLKSIIDKHVIFNYKHQPYLFAFLCFSFRCWFLPHSKINETKHNETNTRKQLQQTTNTVQWLLWLSAHHLQQLQHNQQHSTTSLPSTHSPRWLSRAPRSRCVRTQGRCALPPPCQSLHTRLVIVRGEKRALLDSSMFSAWLDCDACAEKQKQSLTHTLDIHTTLDVLLTFVILNWIHRQSMATPTLIV